MNEIAQIRADASRSQFWTEGRTKAVIRLWLGGHTAAAIGAELGCSRTTVCSKVYRLGLPSRSSQSPREGSIRIAAEVLPDPMPPISSVDVATLHLLDLTADTCRWPVGDPLKDGFGFCGQGTRDGSVYCEHHHRRAYRAAP